MVKRRTAKVKNNSELKKKFEVFAKGVERLKELEKELDSLDTRGFSKEEQNIRAKLKNVSDIPVIEREIKSLRAKIHGIYKPKAHKNKVGKELKKEMGEIEEKLGRKIGRGIHEIKEEVPEMGRKIGEELGEEIEELGEKIESIEKKKRVKIDSDVGVLVDTDFNSFLNDLKLALSKRIKNREKEVDDMLKSDLEEREGKFRERYINLIRDFNAKKRKLEEDMSKKYSKKVRSELHEEVEEKFNKKLKDRLDTEKVELGRRYKEELRQHAEKKLEKDEEKLKTTLQSEFIKKLREIGAEEEAEKEKLEREKERLLRREERDKEEISQEKKKVIKEKEKEREKLQKQFAGKTAELKNKEEKEEKAIEARKARLEDEKERMKKRLAEIAHKKLEEELNAKEKALREQLRNEYELRLRKKLQEHEDELKSRKIDLELELQRKMKQILK